MLERNQFPSRRPLKTGTTGVDRAGQEDFPSEVGPSVVRENKNLRQGKALNLGNLALVGKLHCEEKEEERPFKCGWGLVCIAPFLSGHVILCTDLWCY